MLEVFAADLYGKCKTFIRISFFVSDAVLLQQYKILVHVFTHSPKVDLNCTAAEAAIQTPNPNVDLFFHHGFSSHLKALLMLSDRRSSGENLMMGAGVEV